MAHRSKNIFITCLICLIVVLFFLFSSIFGASGSARSTIKEMLLSYTAYLPAIMNKYPLDTVFGVTLNKFDSTNGLDQFSKAGITWTRKGFIWLSIEPVEGQRNWNAALDQELINASSLNIKTIGILEGTPEWAIKDGFKCGAVKEEKLPALGKFAYDLVKRYSASPYNIRYWELWNEPDAAAILGCWGNLSDKNYYGGDYYGQMLRTIYPMIKAADPQAQVLVGGLLLDCDPENPPKDKDCTPSKFLTGILASGAGNSFDGIAFHAYDYYEGLGKYGFRNWHSASYLSSDPDITTIGPSAIAKGRYLKKVLAQFGVGDKYLLNTETAVFYGPNVPTPPCDENAPPEVEVTKVYHLIHSYASAIAEGNKANVWYSAIGARCSGLLSPDLSPKPAFEAYKFAYQKLGDVTFSQKISNSQIIGYEYQMGKRKLWVIWSKDGTDQNITLPKNPVLINKVGPDGIAVQETYTGTLTVGLSPYFIEFNN